MDGFARSAPSGNLTALKAGLLLSQATTAFEYMAVLAVMPAARDDLGHPEFYAWAFTAFMIAQIFTVVAAGMAADRIGPVRPLLAGMVVFALGLVLAATAPSMALLVLARFVQGLGAGAANVTVMFLVGQAFEPHARARMMTGLSIAWMAPTLVGPVVAAWIAENFSWHWVFWSVLPLLGLAAVLLLPATLRLRLPDPDPTAGSLGNLGRAALVALGAAALQWAGQHLEPWSLLWAALGVGVLVWALPALMPRGYRPWGRGLSAVVGVRALSSGGYYGVEAFLSLMLVTAWRLPLQTAAACILVGSIGWTTGSWVQSQRWLRLRRDAIVTLGALVTATGIAVIAAAALVDGAPLWLVIAGWAVGGIGMGLSHTSSALVVMQLAEPGELGRATSSLQVGEALGNALVGGLAGTIYAVTLGLGNLSFGLVMAAMTVLAGLSVAAARRIGPVENHSAAG
ncbi:MAG: MFS transporter [Propionicimonas sp.]|nr:MFS transporter [Propionicimonas sp.]MEA5054934.1 MFS transporter [Propionicimonas sp.]